MPAALPDRRLLLGAAIACYLSVLAAVIVVGQPGLGISRFFFLAVVLFGLANGPVGGAGGGMLAAGMYAIGAFANPDIPDQSVASLAMAIRVVTYVGVGCLSGFFAEQHRLVARHLRILADRDHFTGLPTSRPFEAELMQRLEERTAFALLLAEVDGLAERSEVGDALQRLPDIVAQSVRPGSAVARVGPNEFAMLVPSRSSEEAGAVAAGLERTLAANGLHVVFGWSIAPQEGRDGLALYRAASDRLYLRNIVRKTAEDPALAAKDPALAAKDPAASRP